MAENCSSAHFEALLATVAELRSRSLQTEEAYRTGLGDLPPAAQVSARNLLHYLGVRQHDLRQLQGDLAELGLSSLGRLEAHTLATLDAVMSVLCRLSGRPAIEQDVPPTDFRSGPELLRDHAARLFGPLSPDRPVRIMVTMPSAAATDEGLVLALVEAGMSVMRINCAHDGPEAWEAMIRHLRNAEAKTGRRCPVLADLAGPKLRTGPIAPLPGTIRIEPRREARSLPVTPVSVWLTPENAPEPPPADTVYSIPIRGDLLEFAQEGDSIRIEDCRVRDAAVMVCGRSGTSVAAVTRERMFVAEGAGVTLERTGAAMAKGTVGTLPPATAPIVVRRGDHLVLTRDSTPGQPARMGEGGSVLAPARMPCSLPEAFRYARPGDPIWFDDGKIGGILREVGDDEVLVEITFAAPKGARLHPGKGINLPDTALDIPALGDDDIEALAFMAGRVDLVALSFVRRPEDVVELQDRLARLGAPGLGIVLKIENRAAVERLPDLLLAGLRSPPVGVMVARGDLAVEVGFARLAEVQEEILCLCEAAHVPVIWATQVLESMARTGMPSRAEVSDAAMGGRAECVMLNKGPHIVEAVAFLGAVLARMGDHQAKKKTMLPQLTLGPRLR